MLNERFIILLFLYVGNGFNDARNVNITVTSNDINITNFNTTVLKMLEKSICPKLYSISVIPYNFSAPFTSPVGKNDFSDVNLVFGPLQYFSPAFFGFKDGNKVFQFPNAHILDSFMDLTQRFKLMLQVVQKTVVNDSTKIVVFVINGSLVNPLEPWKSFNPMFILSTFEGSINIQKYNKFGDGASVCSGIISSKTVTIATDLSRNATLDVLRSCNEMNLLNWRMRWLVFFSSLSLANSTVFSSLPLRLNFTVYDFIQLNQFPVQNIQDEQDIVLSDIAYTVVKLMDYSECNGTSGNINLSTGQFSFNNVSTTRVSWMMDIFRFDGEFKKIGNIYIINENITINQTFLPLLELNNTNLLIEMRSKPFRVAAMIETPFVTINSSNNQISGYCIEMINQIMSNLNVTFVVQPYNLSNGILINGNLNGMLGLLQSGQADIVIGAITLDSKLKSYVYFTNAFLSYKLSVLYKVNQTNPILDIFDFFNAFDYKIWILIVCSCVAYAIALTLVNMISPNEAKFGFLYSFLFTVGSMVQGVTTALPDKISGRILIVFWWIFNIAVLLAYVANYGAILTNDRLQAKIQQISDLSLQEKYSYGTVTNSSVDNFLLTATSADIQSVNQLIRTRYLTRMADSSTVAFNQVNNSGFAFIYPDILLLNYSMNPCMVLTTGENLFSFSFALPLNSDYKSIINDQMNLIDSVLRKNLSDKYLTAKAREVCQAPGWLDPLVDKLGTDVFNNPKYGLNINKTAGIFVIMLFGTIIALIIALIEFLVKKFVKKESEETEKVTVMENDRTTSDI